MIGAFDYAQARMQARHGERAGAAAWAQAHAATTLETFLETARRTPLSRWTSGIETEASEDGRERRLREALRARILEVATWLPESWREAMRRTAQLIELPALQHLAASDPAQAGRLPGAWLAEWRGLWPPHGGQARAAMDALVTLVLEHLAEFERTAPGDAWAARARFASRLERLFREQALEPAAAFAYVLLLALEAERVRAELAAHAMEAAA